MKMQKWRVVAAVAFLLAVLTTLWIVEHEPSQTIRYGVTPYQDSGLPVVADALGWYEAEGLKVVLVPLSWGDVMPALAGGAVDVVIYNMNSFMPAYWRSTQGRSPPLFYAPVFAFKGQAVMVHGDKELMTMPETDSLEAKEAEARIIEVAEQLRGKRVGVTKGTELEQIVLEGMSKAGLTEDDVTLVHGSPEVTLAAFLAGDLDAFAAGLTERVEASKRGAVALYSASDVMPPVINGLVTSEAFRENRSAELGRLLDLWFRTVQYIGDDVEGNSVHIREYLRERGSTDYSPEEYAIAWNFDVFALNREDARELFNDDASSLYWRSAWDGINDFLLSEGELEQSVPYSAYFGESVLESQSP